MKIKLRLLAAVGCLALLGACGGGGGTSGVASTSGTPATSTSSIAFSTTQPTGTASTFETLTLTNNTTASVTLTSIGLTGADPASFAESSNCPSTLAAAVSCTVWVTFGPAITGSQTANLSIVSSAGSSPIVVALTGAGVAPTSPANVAPLVVDTGPIGLLSAGSYQQNEPFTTITVCTPGSTTACQVIDHVLVDTNSTGLRILGQVLAPGGATPTGGAVPVPLIVNGNPLRECLNYGSGYTWGSVVAADVRLGGYTIASLPVTLIGDPAAGAAPTDCAAIGSNLGAVAFLGVNAILGINGTGSLYDCPSCVSAPQATSYYSCPSGGTCTSTAVPLSSMAVNPVSRLPADNNGVLLSLAAPSVNGSQTVTGSLVFGINTEANNSPGNANFLAVSSTGAFTTSFGGAVYTSYLSSTASANFLYSSTLITCADYVAYYCPSGAQAESATLIDTNSVSSSAITFNVNNADLDFTNFHFAALPGLTAIQASSTAPIIWGLPFFFGRSVYVLFSGQVVSSVTGPAIGF